MNRNRIIKTSFVALCFFAVAVNGLAQDTSKRKTIDITSTFKPVLREASKINFNAAPPPVDSSRPRLNYNIPVQHLFFTYQPAALKPVALEVDSLTAWQSSNYIKVGIGNVHQPYIKAGFSFGNDKNTFFNIFANHFTSKGKLPFQKNSLTSVAAAVTYRTPKNTEWYGSLGFKSDDYFLYGYRPDSLKFTKDQLKQRFQTIEGKIQFRNIVPTEFGLTYNPSLRVSVFSDNHSPKASEANTVLTLPLEKSVGKSFGARIGAIADLTNYRFDGSNKKTGSNNIYIITPAALITTPNLYLHAGVNPSWERGNFYLLPNFMADITTNNKQYTIQLGYIGYFDKGSYQRFASINPWLAQPDSLLNTRVVEGYAGFKGSLENHLSYSAKLGIQQHHNMPLFVNDTLGGGKSFLINYEPKLSILQLHGEVEYRQGEQFIAKALVTWNQFSKLDREKKAWGIIPFETTASLHWQVFKDLWVNSSVWVWRGAFYRKPINGNLTSVRGEGGFDLNAGLEFRITKNFNLWFQMNNILNNKYERWNQYEVFGFNMLGGIVYSFNQKK